MNKVVSIKDFLKTEKNTFTIEMSRYIEATPKTIYSILTSKNGLEKFMECEVECDLVVGGDIKFTWAEHCGGDDCSGINGGKIVEMNPYVLFSFTWGDKNPARGLPWGSTLVEFKIEPEGNGACVTIIHHDLPSEKEAHDHTGGWTMFLEHSSDKF